ncbi:MAG: isoleucine--tRNA ligase [Chloroflexi bacterium]|nr:isoleucine--tRNA ligase [Chloroflexota bacterium]
MFEPVNSRVSFPELESRVLQFWKDRDIFRRSVEERPEDKLYSFYEGPPTANGAPGIHHVLARVFKDLFPRYWTMKGYRVPRKGGWDTHGLPVELEVERDLGLKSKPEIEAYGVEAFNRKCRESVWKYVQEWERMTERIGFWVDMEDAYVTYANDYIETGWWIFRSLWDHGLVTQDYRSTPHCPRCGTSLSSHELALGYQEDTPDPSVYVQFRLAGGEGPGTGGRGPRGGPAALRGDVPVFFLAWTTTPWTLPGNTALAVASDAEYAVVEVERDRRRVRLVLASALVEAAVSGERTVVGTVRGEELVGLLYEPLYEPAEWGVDVRGFEGGQLKRFASLDEAPPRRVVATNFVSMEDGTGIVHIAPAFGGEDYETGKREGLRFVLHVDLRGNIMGDGPFSGQFVKDADKAIRRDLRERGLLLRDETIRHTYPFCWRCDTPLLYIAKPSWYIRTSVHKDKLLANNERVNWYPEHIRHGRFGDWLSNNVDWAVSRERYWGTPLPIWICRSCQAAQCIGSVAEMVERAVDQEAARGLDDLHRPYVDDVLLRCDECGGVARRVPEVADAWFDSGAMPYAQSHYPFENKEEFERRFPADFICEAIDQTRGWFYTLHAESTLLNAIEEVPSGIAFKNCVVLGHILDKNGEKMSKTRGNAVNPWEMLDQYGADSLRWYLYTASPFGQPRRFNPDQVGETLRRFFLTVWNTYSFLVTYANIDGWTPAAGGEGEPTELDRWVLSELNLTVKRVTEALEEYNATDAGRAVDQFVESLSNWYVRRSRRRFWKTRADSDKLRAYRTLHTCLVTVSQLIAPMAPFVADELWQNLVRSWDTDAPESVHLSQWPAFDVSLIDERLSADVQLVMRLASLGRSARARAKVKVRQPLAEVIVRTRSAEEDRAAERLGSQLLEELNVKALRVAGDEAGLVDYDIKLNLPVVARRLGARRQAAQEALTSMSGAEIAAAVRDGRPVEVAGETLEPNDLIVTSKERTGYVVAQEAGYTVALSTEMSAELADEGLARELVHRLQTLRKDAGFEIADRIVTFYEGDGDVARVMENHADYIAGETLSRELVAGSGRDGAHGAQVEIDGRTVRLAVQRAG